MLSSDSRLRKPYEINRVYKRGLYGSGEGLISVKVWRSGRAQSRAVVVVGKKVSKRAVVRNSNRRRLAAQLRGIWGTVACGYDIVVNVHQDTAELTPLHLSQLLRGALGRAKI